MFGLRGCLNFFGQGSRTKIYFQPPPPTLSYHSNVQIWRMFLKNTFRQFSCKGHQNSTFFFAISLEGVPNVVCCGNFGLIFRLMASWWQFSYRILFCASTSLNWAILSPWHQEWVIRFAFLLAFRKSYFRWLSTRGTGFLILNRDSLSKIWTLCVTVCNANQAFCAPKTQGGGGHFVPLAKPLLPFSEFIQVKVFWKLVQKWVLDKTLASMETMVSVLIKFGGEWCLSSTFLSLQCDHKCAYATTGVTFHHFSQAFEEKNSGAMIKKDEKSLKGGSCL